MRLRVIAVLAIAALAISLAGCGAGGAVKVGQANAGDKVSLSVGQQMEIALASNPTTGFSWQVSDDAGGIVELVGDPEFVRDPGPSTAVGRGGAERFTFEAKEAGSGTLVLEYRRPWEKGVPAEKVFEIPVEVK